MVQISCNKSDLPLGGLITAEYIKLTQNVQFEISYETVTKIGNTNCRTSNDLARALAKLYNPMVAGKTNLEITEVNHWLTFALGTLSSKNQFSNALDSLNKALAPVTYLVGKTITIADYIVFAALYESPQWNLLLVNKSTAVNVLRWYNFIYNQQEVKNTLQNLPDDVKISLTSSGKTSSRESVEKTTTGRAKEGKFVELPGAEMGKVVVRFPPEASGYLHIGHAKAALLNQYYQETFQGKLIMRFDDTNPAKENVHFEKVILEDLAMLEIKPDMFSYTSQYFDLMLSYCEKLLKEGNAYVDDTEAELMKSQREQKVESINRTNSVERNFELWEEMKKGSDKGQQCCVRAKIDMQSPNGCLRDPTIYRCKNEPHPRTGNHYKVYPTYDFACPIVDSIEGVTHTLRTMEYHDRDPQFYWFIEALGLRKPYIWEYSRLSMTNTVLSKRKLTWFVEQGLVDGWDDPRMPTVRGVLRRGMTVEGLKEFIIAQGSSRSVVFMEWDKIWAFNKKVIDPIVPRYTALEYDNTVPILVKGDIETTAVSVPTHPKNASAGEKQVWLSSKILIDSVDVDMLKEGENATFINWGNLLIKKINRNDGKVVNVEAELNLDNKDFRKTPKLTWLADVTNVPFTPTYCVYFDHIISKAVLGKDEDFKQYIGHPTRREVRMLGDPELSNLKKGDIIQLQRRGFFKVDVAYEDVNPYTGREQSIILFAIPDGHVNDNPLGLPKVLETQEQKSSTQENLTASQLNDEINKQGDVVRKLKDQKAAKGQIDSAVNILLSLKARYKTLTNTDWKPINTTQKPAGTIQKSEANVGLQDENTLLEHITVVGNKVRELKSNKADKSSIDEAVKELLALKNKYKLLTGRDWKPGTQLGAPVQTSQTVLSPPADSPNENDLLDQITVQGDKVRQLKAAKAEKVKVDEEVKKLLDFKTSFKNLTGKDWKPGMKPQTNPEVLSSSPSSGQGDSRVSDLAEKITKQGDLVRELKSNKDSKDKIEAAVKILLNLKAQYKEISGTDFPSQVKSSSKPIESKPNATTKEKSSKQKTAVKEKKPVVEKEDIGAKKQTRLGLEAKKEENLSEWYSQVITKGELIEYYDVSGCYILRPWSYAIWEAIRDFFDGEIKKLGVQNCYFPIFVSKAVLEKEKNHIADFSPEVAWVTKSGDSDMAEPVAIRPTSETVMYPAYAKWIQSYRDLPIKLNQWNNVVRWEFKHPQPFLRTREFLWQEGHTAFADVQEAHEEVKTILDIYAKIYTDLMAIPVIKGRKTEKEKFAGGDYTLTVEAFVSASGRAIQGATSHHLAQNFSKMFDIIFEDPETQEKKYVYQNSWGITTRTIGVMVMVHADNQGLVLPPRVASIQVVIVPCGIAVGLPEITKNQLQASCDALQNDLMKANVRVKGDYRLNYSPGWKFNHWELKGVPLRIELGPKDIEKQQLVAVRRDTGAKVTIPLQNAVQKIQELLDDIQNNLYNKAVNELNSHVITLTEWAQFPAHLDKKNILLVPYCGDISCEDKIKTDSARNDTENAEPGAPSMGAKALCIPLEQPCPIKPSDKCIHPDCTRQPKAYTLFGRSY